MNCYRHGGDSWDSSGCLLCQNEAMNKDRIEREMSAQQQNRIQDSINSIKAEIQNDKMRAEAESRAKRSTDEICPKCGQKVKGIQPLCTGCGTELQKVCAWCEKDMFVTWKFCMLCGCDEETAKKKNEEREKKNKIYEAEKQKKEMEGKLLQVREERIREIRLNRANWLGMIENAFLIVSFPLGIYSAWRLDNFLLGLGIFFVYCIVGFIIFRVILKDII